MVSWRDAIAIGDGRSTVWINSASELHYKFAGSKPPLIDHDQVRQLIEDSSRSGGIELGSASLTEAPHSGRSQLV